MAKTSSTIAKGNGSATEKNQTTFLEAIRQALFEEMERDPAVVMIGEDIGVYGGAFKVTAGLLERFGWERVIDTPISETAIIGAAVGMSYQGLRPVAEMQFIDFIACCFNQLTNFVAKSHYRWGAPVPMVVRGPSGGGVHGGPFHSQNPEMYFAHTPGLKVVYPATAYDAKGLMKSAIRDNNPVLFFEHKFLYRRIKEELPEDDYTGADWQSGGEARGTRSDDCVVTRRWCTRRWKPRKHWRKKASSAKCWICARCCRWIKRNDSGQRDENEQAAGGARGHAHGRRGRRNGGAGLRKRV